MWYGYFDTDNDEYVVERPDVPVSWTNYLGTSKICTVLSHNGGGYSYYDSAEKGRITRFRPNGVPLDRPGLYVCVQFFYGRDHEWFGKAQNPWLTGTAGWMYTTATKHILGIRPDFFGLVVAPLYIRRVGRGHGSVDVARRDIHDQGA